MGRTSALINLLLLAFPLVAGLLVAVFFPLIRASNVALLPIFASVVGGVLLVVSKLPRFASGRWVSFGAAGLPFWARFAYWSGYVLLACSMLAAFAIFAAVR